MQEHKGPRNTILPLVSKETRQQLSVELDDKSDGSNFGYRVLIRLETENPTIHDYLVEMFGLLKKRGPERAISPMLWFAAGVYRMLELSGPLPKVSKEIGAPLQTDFLRDYKKFYRDLMVRILRDNPEVASFAVDCAFELMVDEDMEAAAWVPFAGCVVYRMLESQMESDALFRRFGSK